MTLIASVALACGDDGGSSAETTGTSSATTSAAATTVGSTSDGSGSDDGQPPPGACTDLVPAASYEAPIATLGVPYDVRQDDTWASPEGPSGRFGSIPRLVVHANSDGTLDVAWYDEDTTKTFITHLCHEDGQWRAAWHLDVPSLDRLVGFDRDDAGNFYVATAIAESIQYEVEPMGVQRDGILQLVRLDPDGNEAYLVDLRSDAIHPDATPFYQPMSFGTGVLKVAADVVMIGFAALTEYDPMASSRHQYCTFVTVDAATGELAELDGFVSHCFDQKIVHDETSFVGSALGDANFRGIGVAKINETPFNIVLAVKGGDEVTGGGYQNTFTRMGDVALGANGYAHVFATEDVPQYQIGTVNASRNVGFVHLVPDVGTKMPDNFYDVAVVDTAVGNDAAMDFEVEVRTIFGNVYDGSNKQIVWLTEYADVDTEHAERPKLVRLGDDSYAVLWEKWTRSTYVETMAMVVDEYGNVVVDSASLGASRLQRGDSAAASGDRAAWVVAEAEGPRLVLHLVDDQLQAERHEIP